MIKMPVFAVHGNEILRFDQRMDELKLFLARVTGHMDFGKRVIDNVCAGLDQLVEYARYAFFVSGDGSCGYDDHVAGADFQLFVLLKRHARKTAHGFALAACRDDDDFVIRISVQIIRIDQIPFGNGHIAQLRAEARDVHHASSDQTYAAVTPYGSVDNHLDAVNVACEHRDDDTSLCAVEKIVERFADFSFAHGVAGTLDIGGIRHQKKNAFRAQSAQPAQIHQLAVDGRIIHLEIARVNDNAHRRMNGQGACSGDGVAHADKLYFEYARGYNIAGLDYIYIYASEQFVLFELAFNQSGSQARGIHGRRDFPEHIRSRADMVFMAVGDHISANAVAVHLEIGCVRDDEVYAGHVLAREDGADIHNDDIVAVLKSGHVLSDLTQTAQGDDAQCIGIRFRCVSSSVLRRNGFFGHKLPPFLC